MNRFLTLPLAFLIALPLAADEPKAQTQKAKSGSATVAPAAPAADSPMVQAMKRANRAGRKPGRVITNETLRTSRGHDTVTTTQRSVEVPEPQLSDYERAVQDMARAREEDAKVRAVGEEKQKRAAEERERRAAASATRAEEGLYEEVDDDPAQAERAAEETRDKPPGEQ